MAKIKRYKLVDGFDVEDYREKYRIKEGGSWACDGSENFVMKSVYFRKPNDPRDEFEFSIYVCFPEAEKMEKWNDLDYILVLDDDFGQPYTPFYRRYGEDVNDCWCLEKVIEKYNEWMDSLEFLEEIENGEA